MDAQHQYRTVYVSPLNWPDGKHTLADATPAFRAQVNEFFQTCVPGMPLTHWYLDVNQANQRIEFEPPMHTPTLQLGALVPPVECACCPPVPVQWSVTWNGARALYRLTQ